MSIFRVLLLLSTLLISNGCNRKEPKERFVRISFRDDVRSLDPAIGVDYPSAFVTRMLFEGLLYMGPDGNLQPAIAQSYEISENLKTYTFHLRPAFWSNGDPVTANDFEYSWKKIINPATGAIGVHNFYPIKNAREAYLGQKPLASVGIKALDSTTLEVKLTNPTPYFLEILATASYFPVNARVDKGNPSWINEEGDAFVCNGPYRLHKHLIENEILVTKNLTYWNAEQVTMPGIHVMIIKDPTTQLGMFENGELDWLGKPFSKMTQEAIEHLRSKDEIHFYKTLGLYWFFVNTEAFPFNNVKMRKAFSYAIDREALTNHILSGKEEPAMGILPYSLATQSMPFFKDNNTELAKQLFNEALVEMGIEKDDPPEITLNYVPAASNTSLVSALQEHWNLVFNINVKLEQQDWKSHYAKLQKGNFQIGGMGYHSWLRDPIYLMQIFHNRDDSVNMSRWENKEYQKLIEATEKETSPAQRTTLFNQAEAILMEEMPVIPLYFQTIVFSKNKSLKNVQISDLYDVDFRWSYFEE